MRLTRASIQISRLRDNLAVLGSVLDGVPMWPVVKANAYGHGAQLVAPILAAGGYRTLCVADVSEAAELLEAGVDAQFLVLSATLPEHARALVEYNCQPVVCTRDMVRALDDAARAQGKCSLIHLKVDTGMNRLGLAPQDAPAFLDFCASFSGIKVHGLMSHLGRADEGEDGPSQAQLALFRAVAARTRQHGIAVRHMANSAAVLDLPKAHFDAVRPGIAMYGLQPSARLRSPLAAALRPVLRWETRITWLKEVPAGSGLSYGHAYSTAKDSLIATVPVGYGDGLSRLLSNRMDMLVHGVRCPQRGRITMDNSLLDVSALRGRVTVGDEVVIIGEQAGVEIGADELAATLGTINYEVVTAISSRVARVAC